MFVLIQSQFPTFPFHFDLFNPYLLLHSGPEIQNHICNSDQFLVSGGSTVPVICGISHGDHSKWKCFDL